MNKLTISISIVLSLVIVLINSVYIVDQRQMALVIQLGEPIRQSSTPGIHFKVPLIQNVVFFDKRIQNLSSNTSEVIASDQKTMRVDSFGKYKIIDALKFYQTVQSEDKFKSRLAPILDSSLRQVLGGAPFKALISPQRSILMGKIRDLVNTEAASFGVEVVDVRIMRADLPEKSREAVFQRMKTERVKEANEIRAQGDEEAQFITSKADKDKVVILAEAKSQSQILRGKGEAESIKISANSFNQDPDFYNYYRTLQAYKKTITSQDTKIILTPDSEFMKYFSQPSK